jgi:hypothetical protein
MPAPHGFEEQFERYRAQALDARQQGQHHDQRRELFLTFITQAFRLNPADIVREELVSLVRRHGWIDALFRDLVFEFKRDLGKERLEGKRELRDYLSQLRYSTEHIGLLTDGLEFEVYVLSDGELCQSDSINLAEADPETAFLWLDSYLFSQKGIPPTSADLVRRFGAASPTFQGAARMLGGLLNKLGSTPAIKVKRDQWHRLLTRVYGSDVTSDELFIRHTYLAQFAKVLAYTAHSEEGSDSLLKLETFESVVNGKVFQRQGFANVGEPDFFGWVLEPEVKEQALSVLRGLAGSLIVYNLSQINEDLFKQLYQNLVDPSTRHDLGEYYTPDWLAELTLEEINYQFGQSLLDPSCGSGTFLFSAIRRLIAQGVIGWDLINFALDHIVGMDIHPLAVIVARINYYLALLPHLDIPGPSGARGPMRDGQPVVTLLSVPVYNADALAITDEALKNDSLLIPVDEKHNFHVPTRAASDPSAFDQVLQNMEDFARWGPKLGQQLEMGKDFETVVQRLFPRDPAQQNGVADLTMSYWANNLRLYKQLIDEGRNGIWLYVLNNQSRPLILSLRRFDRVVGNPPWLSYRFIKDKTYQNQVRALTIRQYGLLPPTETKLFTQMDLSTLFYVYCEDKYRAGNGMVAFVMPRSVLTGAKQHLAFQQRGFTTIIDLKGVQPLFNVEACVVVRQAGEARMEAVPVISYSGRLPRHELSLDEARPYFTRQEELFSAFEGTTVQSPRYYDHFKQGATLVPRNLIFASPTRIPSSDEVSAFSPTLRTDPDMDADAKAPWKGIRLEGHVDPPFWFATLLSKHLVPFGVRQFNLVILPLKVREDGSLAWLEDEELRGRALVQTRNEWLAPAEKMWEARKKETTQGTLWEWVNYQNKLISQWVRGVFKVVYNGSATHLAAAVIDTCGGSPKAHRYPTQALVTEATTYSADFSSADEAHYLCALLNAPSVDEAIKRYQPRGLFGERHIHRRPFEYCAIPPFDAANADHLALASLSRQAHAVVTALNLAGMSTARAREAARQAAADQIGQIDVIARRLLGL